MEGFQAGGLPDLDLFCPLVSFLVLLLSSLVIFCPFCSFLILFCPVLSFVCPFFFPFLSFFVYFYPSLILFCPFFGPFLVLCCPFLSLSFFVLSDFWGIFPICSFPLSQPISSTYEEQSRKGPRPFPKKGGKPPWFGHPAPFLTHSSRNSPQRAHPNFAEKLGRQMLSCTV